MDAKKEVTNLVSWLNEILDKTNASGFIIGISGGIDSAVVTNLINLTKGEKLGLILPCDSNKQDKEDAYKVLHNLNINSVEFDLTPTYNLMLKSLKKFDVTQKLAISNLKARLRMSTLYTFAQQHNYLVVGTDNACEWHIGYFTKYGDGGVDLVPIIKYNKGEVRQMAKYLNVHQDIILKKPSAGLWENQNDEDELGLTYETIDKYLSGQEIDAGDKLKIDSLHKKSEHKRSLAYGYLRDKN